MSNTLSDRLRDQIADIMNTDKPSVVQQAVVPDHPVSPSAAKNTAVGALLGALIAIAVIIVRYMMDDTIKTPEDVEKEFGVLPLSVIPEGSFSDDKDGGKNSRRKLRKAEKGGSVQ